MPGRCRSPRRHVVLAWVIVSLCISLAAGCNPDRPQREAGGMVVFTVRDAATGDIVPARVQLLDADGRGIVPEDALVIFSDCGNVPAHTWIPGAATLQTAWRRHRAVHNPYTDSTQFYTDGTFQARLPAGRYSVGVTRGIEYRRYSSEISVGEGAIIKVEVDLERWVDLAGEGWYAADDHLHIQRPHPHYDARLATWMAAEGLNVANLLQMGFDRDVQLTPQYGFGADAVYRRGDTLILSGQENPRTHILGHTIVLGARDYIDFPRDYLRYDRVWEAARHQGGVNGYAHWGLGGAEEGLALWGHGGLLDFIEVLNLGFPYYERWYEALNLGYRIGPTAGSDYPCLPGLPGRERFYARPDGPLDAQTWLEAVRRGRTFVTNGPAVEFSVEDTSPGDELRLAGPRAVQVTGAVRFDPDRDDVEALELIREGAVVVRADKHDDPGMIRIDTRLDVARTTWVALRASGVKRGETPIYPRRFFSSMLVLERDTNEDILGGLPEGPVARPSAAHTAAVRITVAGSPPLARQPRGRQAAAAWLARLDRLAGRLTDEQLPTWTQFPGRGDGVEPRTARANRSALRDAIEGARRHYSERLRHDRRTDSQ